MSNEDGRRTGQRTRSFIFVRHIFAAVVWNSTEDHAAASADGTIATYHAAAQALAKEDFESLFMPYGPTWHYVLSQPAVECGIGYLADEYVPKDLTDFHSSVDAIFQKCDGYCGKYVYSYPVSGENIVISLWGWDSMEVSSVFGCQVNVGLTDGLVQAHMIQSEVNDEYREAGEIGVSHLKYLKHNYAHYQTWP